MMHHLGSFQGQEAEVSIVIFAFLGGLLTLTPLLATSRAYPQYDRRGHFAHWGTGPHSVCPKPDYVLSFNELI